MRLVSLWDSMGLVQDQKVGTGVLGRADVGICMVFRLSPGRGVTRPVSSSHVPATSSRVKPRVSHPFSTGKEVCYGRLGCFSDSEPWGGTVIRPLKVLPWSPEKIGTRFLLYTNENPNTFQVRPPSS